MAEKMKTIAIKGRPYVQVNDRLKAFRENFPKHSLISEVLKYDGTECIIRATVLDPDGKVVATGHAQEVKGSSKINETSFLENCETSAWGRALGNFGIGIDDSICTAEELLIALDKQEHLEDESPAKKKAIAETIEIPSAETFVEQICGVSASPEDIKMIESMAEKIGQPIDKICKTYSVKVLKDLTPSQAREVIEKLKGAMK